jgi:hypothetical protein
MYSDKRWSDGTWPRLPSVGKRQEPVCLTPGVMADGGSSVGRVVGPMLRSRTNSSGIRRVRDPQVHRRRDSAEGADGATGDQPSVQLHYYVLVTVNSSGQTMGQFLPSVAYWGLPPFAPPATSLEIVTNGSLVLDALLPSTAGTRKVICRGIAQSTTTPRSLQSANATEVRGRRGSSSNQRRRHSTIGYLSPAVFERRARGARGDRGRSAASMRPPRGIMGTPPSARTALSDR